MRAEDLVSAIESLFMNEVRYKTKMRDGNKGHTRHIRHMMENAILYVDKMLDPYNEHPNPADVESEKTLLEVRGSLDEACSKIKSVKETKKRRF